MPHDLDDVVRIVASHGYGVHDYFRTHVWPRRGAWLGEHIDDVMTALEARRRRELAFRRPPPINPRERFEYELRVDDGGTLIVVLLADGGLTLFNVYLRWN
jgi:hypothetical protein